MTRIFKRGRSLNEATTALGKKLRTWRKRESLTQKAAAKKLRVSYPTLQGWEAGRHEPQERHVETIRRVTGNGSA